VFLSYSIVYVFVILYICLHVQTTHSGTKTDHWPLSVKKVPGISQWHV